MLLQMAKIEEIKVNVRKWLSDNTTFDGKKNK